MYKESHTPRRSFFFDDRPELKNWGNLCHNTYSPMFKKIHGRDFHFLLYNLVSYQGVCL